MEYATKVVIAQDFGMINGVPNTKRIRFYIGKKKETQITSTYRNRMPVDMLNMNKLYEQSTAENLGMARKS